MSVRLRHAGTGPDWPGPPRLAALIARLRGHGLNRQLAHGVVSWSSPVHAARSLQLTSDHHRRALADSLERLLAEARRPPRVGRIRPVVAPDVPQVTGAAAAIEEVVGRLRGSEPVHAEGMARLVELLSDGAGPFYCPRRPGTLARELKLAARRLDIEE